VLFEFFLAGSRIATFASTSAYVAYHFCVEFEFFLAGSRIATWNFWHWIQPNTVTKFEFFLAGSRIATNTRRV